MKYELSNDDVMLLHNLHQITKSYADDNMFRKAHKMLAEKFPTREELPKIERYRLRNGVTAERFSDGSVRIAKNHEDSEAKAYLLSDEVRMFDELFEPVPK